MKLVEWYLTVPVVLASILLIPLSANSASDEVEKSGIATNVPFTDSKVSIRFNSEKGELHIEKYESKFQVSSLSVDGVIAATATVNECSIDGCEKDDVWNIVVDAQESTLTVSGDLNLSVNLEKQDDQ
jgi:hypothetical protein